jgi:hypothetical protein
MIKLWAMNATPVMTCVTIAAPYRIQAVAKATAR